jgi:hypothetical protein
MADRHVPESSPEIAARRAKRTRTHGYFRARAVHHTLAAMRRNRRAVRCPLLLEFDFTPDLALRSDVQRIADSEGVFQLYWLCNNARVVREGKIDV